MKRTDELNLISQNLILYLPTPFKGDTLVAFLW